MLNLNTTFATYFASAGSRLLTRININTGDSFNTYNDGDIYSAKIFQALTTGSEIFGNVMSSSAEIELRDVLENTFPKAAEVQVQQAVKTSAGLISPYILRGIYYINNRNYDKGSGVLTLSVMDKLALADVVLIGIGTTITWENETTRTVAARCATALGVPLENAEQIVEYSYPAPPFGYTIRQILQDIAVMSGGNFCIAYPGGQSASIATQSAKLRLVKPTSPGGTHTITSARTLALGERKIGARKVILNLAPTVDGVSQYVEAENISSSSQVVIEKSIPTMTSSIIAQGVANALLNTLQTLDYYGYTSEYSYVSPSIELGDAVVISNTTLLANTVNITLNADSLVNLSASYSEENENELPSVSNSSAALQRMLATTSAYLSVTADNIRSEVIESFGANDFSATQKYSVGDYVLYNSLLYKCVSAIVTPGPWDASKWERVTEIPQNIGQSLINQTIGKIELSVTSGNTGSKISLTSNGVTIESSVVDMHVKALNIDGNISANQLTLTNSINFTDLTQACVEALVPSYIKSTYIDGARVMSPNIYGGNIYASESYPATGTQHVKVDTNGLKFFTDQSTNIIRLGADSVEYQSQGESLTALLPTIYFGQGAGADQGPGLIKKFFNGMWIGENFVSNSQTFTPSMVSSVPGMFFDFVNNVAVLSSVLYGPLSDRPQSGVEGQIYIAIS